MDGWREYKTEISVFVCGFVAVTGMMKLFVSFKSSRGLEAQEISYEMPRPKSDMIGDFGLDGREVERRLVNPFGEKKAPTAKAPVTPPKAPPGKNVSQNKTKKAKGKTAEKNATAANQSGLNVIDATPGSRVSEGEVGGGNQQIVFSRVNRGGGAVAPQAGQQDGDKMSPDQWRALLTAEPTAANMVKLVQAMTRQEVDQATFYSIVEDLLRSQNVDTQKIAVYGLSAVSSIRSFTMLVKTEDQVDQSVRPQIQQALSSYTQSSRLGVLQQALQQDDLTVSMKAAQIVLEGIQLAKNPSVDPQDPRLLRGEIKANSLDDYSRLLPVFQRWAASGNPSLMTIANQVLQAMGTTAAAKVSARDDFQSTF